MKIFESDIRNLDNELIKKKKHAADILYSNIVMIQNFPKFGHRYLDFYLTFDINPHVRSAVIDCFKERYLGYNIDAIAAIGNGGFTLGSCLAFVLGLPLFPIRKASNTVFNSYNTNIDMVYANRELTLSKDIKANNLNIVLIDDTIATGGSFKGGIDLLTQAGAFVVEIATVFETTSKLGRSAVSPISVFSILAKDEF